MQKSPTFPNYDVQAQKPARYSDSVELQRYRAVTAGRRAGIYEEGFQSNPYIEGSRLSHLFDSAHQTEIADLFEVVSSLQKGQANGKGSKTRKA